MMYNVQYRTYQQICMHSASKGLFTGKQDMYLYSTPKYLYNTRKFELIKHLQVDDINLI